VLRDPFEVQHRKCITSIIAPDPVSMGGNSKDFKSDKHSILFTASRDRMVKLWSVSFAASRKDPSRLLCNFDGHMDWVNQIKLIEEANTLVSCSNDTTIKVWRLKQIDDYLFA
jgi:WD40 repeat protein